MNDDPKLTFEELANSQTNGVYRRLRKLTKAGGEVNYIIETTTVEVYSEKEADIALQNYGLPQEVTIDSLTRDSIVADELNKG